MTPTGARGARNMPENEDAVKYKNFYLDKEHYEMVEELMTHYRAPTLTHAVRLAIEDAVKAIRGGNGDSKGA